MKLRISALILSAVFAVASFLYTEKCEAEASGETVKILSVGDSITDGYGTDGSYRKFLYRELSDKGYSIDMTGPNWSWGDAQYSDPETGDTFTYDAAHCGYSGYAIQEYSGRNGIFETIQKGGYLKEYDPDIVILQIGTNDVIDNHDIDTAGERLETLVDYILGEISESSVLFVTTIPDLDPNRQDVYAWFANYRHSADWSQNYSDDEAEKNVKKQVENYNKQVKELVNKKQNSGVNNIFSGDINSVVNDVKTQLGDGVHPNNTGYSLMGHYWAEQLETYLSGDYSVPTDPPAQHEKIKGDVNDDGVVSTADLIFLQKYLLGIQEADLSDYSNSDLNDDDITNIIDLILLKELVIK